MFNWLKNSDDEPRLSARHTIRTITTERGTKFDVFAESPHYVLCHPPEGNSDRPSQALLDLEEMATQGYWVCHIPSGLGGSFIVFEKRSLRGEG